MQTKIITSCYELADIKRLIKTECDALILGSPFFSVRSSCHFNDEELAVAIKQCHDAGIEAYFLLNRFFVEKEIVALDTQLLKLKDLKIDGIYFTDMAVYERAKQWGMEGLLIYNPDTLLTSSADIKAYLNLGIKRSVIAKEITLDEMVRISELVPNQEIIIHGRLNMMHSKRTLLSAYQQQLGLSETLALRDDLYLIEEKRDEHMPIFEDEYGTHVFTGFSLCSFEEALILAEAGINYWRIETLFTDIEDVLKTINDYCEVLAGRAEGKKLYEAYVSANPGANYTKGFMYKKTGLSK